MENDRRVIVFNADAPTAGERKANLWLCTLILIGVGLPSVIVAGVSMIFNAMFAYSLGASEHERAAWVAGSIGFSLFVFGIPIARPIIRARRPDLDRWAGRLWLACVCFSVISALGFSASTRGHSAAVAQASIEDRTAIERRIARGEDQLAALPRHRPAATVESDMNRALAANSIVQFRTKGCTDITTRASQEACAEALRLRAELAAAQDAANIEMRLTQDRALLGRKAVVGTASDPQAEVLSWLSGGYLGQETLRKLLSVFVAGLIEAGSAIGLSLAAESFVTVLRDDRRETPGAPAQEPLRPLIELPATDVTDTAKDAEAAFKLWCERCVSVAQGARIAAAEAFSRYETWTARNGMPALPYLVFGRRMSEAVTRLGGSLSKNSSRFYEGVSIADGGAGTALVGF